MALIVSAAVEITSEMLKPSVYMSLKIVDGVQFFNVQKRSHKIARILLQRSTRQDRGLAATTIIETITELRDKSFWSTVGAEHRPGKKRRYGDRKKDVNAKAIAAEDDIVTITVPQIGDIPAQELKVLLAKPGGCAGMHVEMSSEVLKYLGDVVAFQTADVQPRATRHRDEVFTSDIKGLSVLYGKNAIRASKIGGNGKVQTKLVMIRGGDAELARQAAEKFVCGGDEYGDDKDGADEVDDTKTIADIIADENDSGELDAGDVVADAGDADMCSDGGYRDDDGDSQ